MRKLRAWWGRRPLRVRITLTVGAVALVALLALSRLATALAFDALVDSTDQELRAQAQQAVAQLTGGAGRVPGVLVVDRAGRPVDGGPPLPLDGAQVSQLAAGEGVTTERFSAPRRWVAVSAVAPDGTLRFAVASADLVGGTALMRRTAGLAVVGALFAALVVAGAAWVVTRAALRPVDRLRTAAAALPPGDRLPVPAARDEVRALAEELNALLARRDEAVARLERFTGDAAHELRSPVAAIRAQAEVAVAHPDPALADETLRAVAVEAERLTAMLADLLALARADAGQRPPASPVDLTAAARAAIGRQNRHGAVVKLVAAAPAVVAASPGEVALVLDNLLGNALRYARAVVQVGVLPAGRTVRLVVEDDGPGIPTADRDRVFDRFTRLEPDVESRAGGGAGLGLALVTALVAGRGGTVVAGEAPGGGARLEVRWPATRPGPPPGPDHPPTGARLGSAPPPRVGTFAPASPRVRHRESASSAPRVRESVRPGARTTGLGRPSSAEDDHRVSDACGGVPVGPSPDGRFGSILRSDVLIDAPPRTVAGVLRDSVVAGDALSRLGHRVTAPVRLLAPGDELRVAVRLLPGVRIPLRTRITHVDTDGMVSVLARGPLRALEHVVALRPSPVGTWLRDELRWTGPLGPLGGLADRVLVRRAMRRVLAARAKVIATRAEELAAAPAVVATALVRDGRVLVAQRTRPPELAGRWELPGGRVEPGEDEAAAVVRECREELGTEVVPDGRVGTDLPIDVGVLRVHRARLAAGAPEPQAFEHAAVRWIDAAEVPGVDWVDADRAVAGDLVRMLTRE